ncbi:hypothetical protein EDD15DRAFT_2362759 [Pisolithus albus]|nr:hypothetical protein EDD15DRAFT_2362759 [Pisolithus albus]
MHERDRHRQLVEEGSENDTNEELAEDEQSDSDNEDNRFTSHEVLTKLSEATNERLTYCEGKVPKPSNAVNLSTRGQTDTTDEELEEESHSMSRTTQTSSDHLSSSDCQSSKHKRSKERHGDHRTSEAEDTVDCVASDRHLDKQKKSKGNSRRDYATQLTRQRRAAEEDLAPAMVKAQKLTSHDGHPRARDFDDVMQEFMATMIREYRARLCAQAPMPDHAQETLLLSASWARACQVTTINMTRTPELVTIRGSQVQGQLKTKLCPLVEAVYGFYSSQSKSALKKNRALAEDLKEGMNFAFKHMAAQEDGRCGFLKAPLIQKIINMMWFANKHDDGVSFADHFNPFPYPALALVLTAIECCIDEWATGTRMDIAFTIQEYRGMFESHLSCLQEFEEAMKEFGVLPGICKKLYEAGRIHSGAV